MSYYKNDLFADLFADHLVGLRLRYYAIDNRIYAVRMAPFTRVKALHKSER
jgi:hypothetical protein